MMALPLVVLPHPALADQAKGLTFLQVETDSIDGLDMAHDPLKEPLS